MYSRYGITIILLLIAAGVYGFAFADWTEPVRIGAPGGILYPQILAQGDTLHVIYSNNDQEWKIGYVRSTDGGDTWSNQQVVSDDSSETIFVRIIENGPRLMVLWRNIFYYQGPRDRNIGYCISNDNGLTWTPSLYVLDQNVEHILHFSASGNGPIVNIILSRHIGYDLFFYSVRSTNFGQSWSEPVELFQAAQSSLTDQNSFDDRIFFSWSGRFVQTGVYETFIISSLDNGETWSGNYMVSSNDSILSRSSSIVVNNLYTVGVSWTDWKYSPNWWTGDIFYRQSSDSGYSWGNEHEVTYDHLADHSDICADDEGIHAVWKDYSLGISRGNIYYKHSTDEGESWSEHYWIDGTDDDSWNPAMASSNGRVYVVWADDREDPGMGLYFSKYENETGVIDDIAAMPMAVRLEAYPNPFNSKVNISLSLMKGCDINIGIYDVNGRLVKQLFKGGKLQKGIYNFTWDATDNYGKLISSGVYFAKTITPRGEKSVKLLLLK